MEYIELIGVAAFALSGALVYCVLLLSGCGQLPSAWASMLLVFALRMLTTHYRWNLPRT